LRIESSNLAGDEEEAWFIRSVKNGNGERLGVALGLEFIERDRAVFLLPELLDLELGVFQACFADFEQLRAVLALGQQFRRRHISASPPAAAAIMDASTYAKSVAYTLAKSRFAVIMEIFDTLVLALVIFGGVLPLLFARIAAWGAPGALWSHALFILLAGGL